MSANLLTFDNLQIRILNDGTGVGDIGFFGTNFPGNIPDEALVVGRVTDERDLQALATTNNAVDLERIQCMSDWLATATKEWGGPLSLLNVIVETLPNLDDAWTGEIVLSLDTRELYRRHEIGMSGNHQWRLL